MMSSTIPILISIPTELAGRCRYGMQWYRSDSLAANVVSPVLFLALSLLLNTMSLDQTHSSNRKSHSNSSFASTIISSFTAIIAVFLCWSTVSHPHTLSWALHKANYILGLDSQLLVISTSIASDHPRFFSDLLPLSVRANI
jgi:hypothetical protein